MKGGESLYERIFSRAQVWCICRSRGRSHTDGSGSHHGENAGFTSGKPWLRINPNYRKINLEDERKNPDSVWNFYRSLIALRKDPAYRETLVYGELQPVMTDRPKLMAYLRRSENQTILIAANFSREPQRIRPEGSWEKVLLNNQHEDPEKWADSRYIHRGNFDWDLEKLRHKNGTIQEVLFDGLRKMEKVRSANPVFRTQANVSTFWAGSDSILAIRREYQGKTLIALFNFTDSEITAGVEFPASRNLMTGRKTEAGDHISLPGNGFVWYLY